MMWRLVAIILTGAAIWAIWFGYDNLKVLRRTVFWEFRYFIFTLGVFLGLSAVEWALGQAKKKLSGEKPTAQ